MKHTTISAALKAVADAEPVGPETDFLHLPVHFLVCSRLMHIAQHPQMGNKTSQAAAVRAQKLILDRMVGKRRAGTHPAQGQKTMLKFKDLTQGAIE